MSAADRRPYTTPTIAAQVDYLGLARRYCIGQLTGNRLKFDTLQADEGAYFVPVGLGAEIKVATVQKNKPSQLVFLISTLAAGDWQIEVRARISGGAELRTGRLDAVLTVT